MTPEEFIEEYLVNENDLSHESFVKMVGIINTLEWEKVKAYILSVNYYTFLKTYFWTLISQEIKRNTNYTCSICGSHKQLQVHHTSYEIHGEEHKLNGLVCLCRVCHQKQHQPTIDAKKAELKRNKDKKKADLLSQIPPYPAKICEDELNGSFMSKRKLLEELEAEHMVVITRNVYEGWLIQENV